MENRPKWLIMEQEAIPNHDTEEKEMDIEKIISDVLAKLKVDDGLKAAFLKDPIATLEKTLGVDLPDEQIKQVIDGIKNKLGGDAVGGILDKVKGIFGK